MAVLIVQFSLAALTNVSWKETSDLSELPHKAGVADALLPPSIKVKRNT